MSGALLRSLRRQYDTAWALAEFHLQGLDTAECLWRPASRGLHVWREADGRWRADWPDHEGYSLGPSSIGWLSWHWLFWWSMVLDQHLGDGTLQRPQVEWPGSGEALRARITGLHRRWLALLDSLDDDRLLSSEQTRWPFRDRPFADVIAWVNIELTKNAAEIGYVRFLYAAAQAPAAPA